MTKFTLDNPKKSKDTFDIWLENNKIQNFKRAGKNLLKK